jgi:hypothetical protein
MLDIEIMSRASTGRGAAIYPLSECTLSQNWRETFNLSAMTNPIAVPWGRPVDARRRVPRLDSALGHPQRKLTSSAQPTSGH